MTPWSQDGSVPEITVQFLAELLMSGPAPFLLDVRQPWENAQASLPNSRLIPLNRLPAELETLRGEIPEGARVVVYCHHGMRSQVGAQALIQGGVPNVVSLAGGIDAYSIHCDQTIKRY